MKVERPPVIRDSLLCNADGHGQFGDPPQYAIILFLHVLKSRTKNKTKVFLFLLFVALSLQFSIHLRHDDNISDKFYFVIDNIIFFLHVLAVFIL